MNRCLRRVLALLFLAGPTTVCLTASTISFAAVEQREEQSEEKEYIESKYFPKKGKYLDWIEANKLSNQGVRLARAGRYKSAISLFQQAIQRYSQDYTYYENLGAALHKSGNLERAESTTEMAAQMAPRRWGPWYNLGLILTKEHEYKRALAALKKAKSLKAPQSKTAGINRLILALERKLEDGLTPSTTAAVTSTESTDTEPAAPVQVQQPVSAAPPGSNSTSSSANSNPYTTVPEVSPIPTVPVNTNEKGN